MTAKIVALYKTPQNPQEFDQRYFDEHVPLVNKMPGVLHWEIAKYAGSATGDEPPYYMVVELYYDNLDALKASLASKEGKEAGDHIMSFAKDILTITFAEITKTFVPATN
jgi:uncharacterized protein (TIGR02118 family)